jgi:hypothetical protein
VPIAAQVRAFADGQALPWHENATVSTVRHRDSHPANKSRSTSAWGTNGRPLGCLNCFGSNGGENVKGRENGLNKKPHALQSELALKARNHNGWSMRNKFASWHATWLNWCSSCATNTRYSFRSARMAAHSAWLTAPCTYTDFAVTL